MFYFRIACCTMLMLAGVAFAESAPQNVTLDAVRVGKSEAKPEPSLMEAGAGKVLVKGAGDETFPVRDGGVLAYATATPDFTFSARIAEVPEELGNTKIGLNLRTSVDGSGPSLSLRFDGYKDNQCVQWLYRFDPGESRLQSNRWGFARDFKVVKGLWLRIDRVYPEVRMFLSVDGKEWKRIADDRYFAFFEEKMLVGLHVTVSDKDRTVPVAFDQISYVKGERKGQNQQELFPTQETQVTGTTYVADWKEKPDSAPKRISVTIPDGVDIRCLLLGGSGSGYNGPLDDGVKKTGIPQGKLWAKHWKAASANLVVPYGRADDQIKLLAKVSGHPELENVPIITMGYSAGTAITAVAATFPDRTTTSIFGGTPINGEKLRSLPTLQVDGERDGPQTLRVETYVKETQSLLPKSMGTQWDLPHVWAKANSFAYPYMDAVIQDRVPADFDPKKGKVKLNPVDFSKAYIAPLEKWKNISAPPVEPFSAEKVKSAPYAFMPNERVARLWQAFSVYLPETAILFPVYRGKEHTHMVEQMIKADQPFTLLATGPVGEGITVEYYADLKKLERLDDGKNPYFAKMKGLPAGLHSIYAITTTPHGKQFSRPNPILFVE